MTTSNEHNNAPAVAWPWLQYLGELVSAAKNRDASRLDQEAAINAAHADLFNILRTLQPTIEQDAPAVPQGWTDADSDSARLALELECLLMDTKDLSVVSKWWASANEALELHRQRLAATPAPAPAQEFNKSVADAEIKSMYVESQGSEKGWLGIEGSYFIGGVVAARKQKAAPAPAQDEPLGHFRAEPFGWTDCAKDDEGAIALYERPQEVGLTDEERADMACAVAAICTGASSRTVAATAIEWTERALRAKGGKHV